MVEKEKERSILNEFLQNAHEDRKKVQVFLLSGIRLEGVVRSYDDSCIILENNASDRKETAVLRASIASIVP